MGGGHGHAFTQRIRMPFINPLEPGSQGPGPH
jgi:hypothetical protein